MTMSHVGKDSAEEAFLIGLNEALAPLEEAGYRDLSESLPTLHVIGVPRSGTTLATQLLATHLDIGYIDHLVAAFWRAPTVGIRLSRKLLRRAEASSFSSEFGRTAAIHEPHEFGYFWRNLLGYPDLSDQGQSHEERIDWARVRRVLVNMADAFGQPIVALRVLPRTCFLRVRRDPVDNALSLWRMREEFHGSEQIWASMKPREYPQLRHRPVHEQLAGQVYFLQRMMDEQLAAARPANVLDVQYEDMCSRPDEFLQRARELLRNHGGDVGLRRAAGRGLEPRRPRDVADERQVAAIEGAFARIAADSSGEPRI
jgi:hypothetical protein